MASKKYSFLAGVFCLLASYGFSQTTTVVTRYDVADSSVYSSKNMPQYTEFMNGTYNFPPKPRSMWELGVKGGAFNVIGDLSSEFFTPGFGVHLRKALGYLVSMRLEYVNGTAKGVAWKPSGNYMNNTPWVNAGYRGSDIVFYNYKTNVQDLSLEALFSLNNISFHKAQKNFNVYALAGIGGMVYETKVNALNGSSKYNFNSISGPFTNDRESEIKDAVDNLLDDSYESAGEVDPTAKTMFDKTFRWVGHVGAGMAFRLSPRVNIALEDRFTISKDDLLDGQRWAEQVGGQPVLTSDKDAYNFLSLGLNFNIGKGVEPLYWLNPLEYAYQEIRKPRLMILPKPTLPDADGDGVTDQFDLEPNTPKGCPVDAHGVSLDTDGDGVPDCRDKEKVTPTYCQPVDADGVGKCPCPEGCQTAAPVADCATALGSLPSITFSGNGTTLTSDARSLLASVAARLRNNPNCRLTVVGYCVSPKAVQSRGVARVDAIVNYLVESEGISRDRVTTMYGQAGGDCGTVDLRGE